MPGRTGLQWPGCRPLCVQCEPARSGAHRVASLPLRGSSKLHRQCRARGAVLKRIRQGGYWSADVGLRCAPRARRYSSFTSLHDLLPEAWCAAHDVRVAVYLHCTKLQGSRLLARCDVEMWVQDLVLKPDACEAKPPGECIERIQP